MIDMLKYFPLQWKVNHHPDEVRGPYFRKPICRRWKFNDSVLHFRAPRSNPIFGFSSGGRTVDAITPGKSNILNASLEVLHFGNSSAPLREWICELFYSNKWYFVGPWFTGEQARLSVNGILVTADSKFSFADKNLFHPRVFESAIANHLNLVFGYEKNGAGTKAHYRGPLNWQVLPISDSIKAVVCDIHTVGNSNKENPLLDRYLYFPIAPNKFIQLGFNFGGTEIFRDALRYKPQHELCNSIIDSMRLEVGAQTKAEWEKVKETCPDISIAETMGEFEWPLSKETKTLKDKEVDVTPNQTRDALEHKDN